MTRTYRMTARAESAQATADRILDAAIDIFWEEPSDEISLEQVARRAGVSKQTVLRRFESKAGLFAAAGERSLARARAERDDVAPGDVEGAVAALVAHYERLGDRVLRMLAQEEAGPGLRAVADQGRAYHASWCERLFAPALDRLRGVERRRRLAQLVAVCDVYTWKLLRRDRGLSRPQTEIALRELLQPLIGGAK
jgi:AcrR family transcriptional regulator